MASINYDFCEDAVLYDSGTIESDMLEMYKAGQKPKNGRFFYATTPVRENITNWYPFRSDSVILELGGGLGSVTGSLCNKARKVISCEYSKRRAENIYNRHKDRGNLEVVVGNIGKIKLDEKVDYIVAIGVFEYSKRFFPGEDPFGNFLNSLKSLLKPDGVILIAIENRYGIKYWAGATEDHYDEKYLGLNGYYDKDIQTLGKKEITEIIERAGMSHKFYYPFPDYKMPYVVFSDDRLPQKTELRNLQLYNHGPQLYNFDYRDVLPGIIDNDQYGFFANSFLIEMSSGPGNFSDVIYSKSSWLRTDEYQTITTIAGGNVITKYPKTSDAKLHMDRMVATHKQLKQIYNNTCEIWDNGDGYKVEYVPGKTLLEYIYELVQSRDKAGILREIDGFSKLLDSISKKGRIKKFTSKRQKILFEGGTTILKMGLVDLNMGNIIKNGDLLHIIDQEWVVEYEIPVGYSLYFSIYQLIEWVPDINQLFDKDYLYSRYKISKKEIIIYKEMSRFFSEKVFKNINIGAKKAFSEQGGIELIDKKLEQLQKDNNSIIRALEYDLKKTKEELSSVYTSKRWLMASKLLRLAR